MAKRTVDIVVKAHDRASRKFKTLGGSVHRLNRHFATLRRVAVAALAGLGTGAVFRSLIKAASDAEEIGSKFAVVFREQAAAADQFAKQLAKSVGRSRVEIRGFLSSMQDLFVPLGFARGDAREMSQALTQLGIDLASFNNKADAEVMRDLQSALVGNHEAVRKYGVMISAVSLDQQLLSMGFAKATQGATEQQKSLARLNLIVKSSADAMGDAKRTAGTFANQMRRLRGSFRDASAELGEGLLPIANRFVKTLNANIPVIKNWAEVVGNAFKTVARFVIGSVTFMETTIRQWSDVTAGAFKWALLQAETFGQNLSHWFLDALPAMMEWFARQQMNLFRALWSFLANFFKNAWKNIESFFAGLYRAIKGEGFDWKWTGLLEGFEATFEELPEIASRRLSKMELRLRKEISQHGENLGVGFVKRFQQRLDLFEKLTGGAAGGGAINLKGGALKLPKITMDAAPNLKKLITEFLAGMRSGLPGGATTRGGVEAITGRFRTQAGQYFRPETETARNTKRMIAELKKIAKSGKATADEVRGLIDAIRNSRPQMAEL